MNARPESNATGFALRLLVIISSLLIAGLILYENRMYYHDDAYISLRYAWNFINGNGLVWNVGEYVQGYTNFLFLLLSSALGYAGVDLQLATRLISAVAVILLLVILSRFPQCLHTHRQQHPLQAIAVLMTISSTPLLVWALGGLETVLFAMLCAAGASCVSCSLQNAQPARTLLFAGLLFALAAITRLDGMLFLGISFLFVLFATQGNRFRNAVMFALPGAVVIGSYLLWAQLYYGDFLPNTFYAKAGSTSVDTMLAGLKYLARYTLTAPGLFMLAAVAAVAYVIRFRRITTVMLYLLVMACAYTAYIVSVGGDHMYSYRMLVPVIPLVAMLLMLFVTGLVERHERGKIIMVYAALIMLSLSQLLHERPLNPRKEDGASRRGTMIGKYIQANWPAESLIALNTAGSTPYYATNNTYIDMLGLNDRHIARREPVTTDLWWQQQPGHTKGDGGYVLDRKPDYIIIGPAQGAPVEKPWFLSDLEMKNDPRFAKNYEMRTVYLSANGEITGEDGMRFRYYQRVSRAVH